MAMLHQLDSVCVILFIQMLTSFNLTNAHEETQYMNHSSTENFTIGCDSLVTSSLCESLTLSQIAENSTYATHVYIDVSILQLQLSGKVEFEHHETFSITGRNTIISCQEENSGLAFVNVKKVTVVNITLTNCGRPYSYGKSVIYYYALRLLQCRDIYFKNDYAINNRGTAVSIISHQGGTVNFSNCSFIENSIPMIIGQCEVEAVSLLVALIMIH